MKLQSKVALITGASSGIGEGTARLLAASGVKVGLAARRVKKSETILKEIKKAGGDGIAIEMDVTDPVSVKKEWIRSSPSMVRLTSSLTTPVLCRSPM